jgi:adenine-specific DNA-methyltransferase
MNKLDGKTMDLVEQNIAELKKLFPEAIIEGKIDFDRLRLLLGDEVDTGKEKYEFTWPGKSDCIRLAQQQSTGTLRPDKESSMDWDTTKNLYIEGDNLEVLRLLQKAYHRKVKMIYIDPPYNTGGDFIYKDDFKDNVKNYKEKTGQALKANPETSGRYHTDWLNMMYPRLKMARNLLREDGVIFISIDDNELANLKVICDEILFEDNLLGILIWDLGTGTTAGHFTRSHEYILVYAKNKTVLKNFDAIEDSNIRHGALKKISRANPASDITFPAGIEYEGLSAEFSGEIGGSEKQYILSDKMVFENGKLKYPVTLKAGWGMKNQVLSWLDGKETFDSKGQRVVKFFFNRQGILWYEKERGTYNPKTVISDLANTKNGSQDLANIFGESILNYPKPLNLIKYLLILITNDDDIILDFFSGSATTAHAIMQLNTEDEDNRRFIMVQLPEQCGEDSEAYKAGFSNICEIGKERIRRAGQKIKEEYKDKEGIENLDIGFRVFKLDTSNLKAWDPDVEELEETLKGMVDPIKEDRTQEDMLYEIMLKYGIDLTMPLEEIQIKDKNAYSIGLGYMIVCLEDGLTLDVIEAIGAMKQSGQEIARVVFRDSGFADDNVKTNAVQLLKKFGIEDFRTI